MDLSLYGTVLRVAAVYDGRVVQNKLPVLIEEIDTVNEWVSALQVSVTSNGMIILGEQRMIPSYLRLSSSPNLLGSVLLNA